MGNAFDEACKIEQASMDALQPFIARRSYNGQYVLTNKGRLAKELQKAVGDLLMNAPDQTIYSIEVKAEREDKYGNLFLETWSNKSRFTLGWMFTLNADLLFYHFVLNDDLYIINFQSLKRWAFSDKTPNIYTYPERPQNKYSQLNDTWGRCVPINIIREHVGLKQFNPKSEQTPHYGEAG